jgi:ATP-binding cassette subfamily B protein
MTVASLRLRAVRALLPVATLYVGKLIIDEAVRLAGHPPAARTLSRVVPQRRARPAARAAGAGVRLAVLSDVLGRIVSLVDSLLSELLTNATSVQLMEHAATLDLEDFEDSELQDKLDRARRQTMGRMTLMTQLFGQAQDLVTVVSFAAGLLVYAPWLMLLLAIALIPAFLGEAHFNALNYSLNFAWTPERRELEYVRQTGASVETAKEVKIFGLHGFLIERYKQLSAGFYAANRKLALTRAWWGSLLTMLGTLGYYIAYGYIAWRTVRGEFSIGDLTFLAGSFRRLRQLLEGLLSGISNVAGQALYLDDLYSFFEIEAEITSPANPQPFPNPIREGFRFEDVGFQYPGRSAGQCATCPSRCRRAKCWRWSARTAPARPRW